MTYRVFIVAALLLGSCSEGPTAEKKYAIVKNGRALSGEVCAAAKATAAAYLNDKNEAKHTEWRLKADVDCTTAQLDADALGVGETDNLESLPDNVAD